MVPLSRLILASSVLLAACDPVTMGLVTASGGLAVNHQMAATTSRTFSDGARHVQDAVLAALDKMSMVVRRHDHKGDVEVIEATAGTRAVSLHIEPVTRTSTLLQVAVHQDLLTMDGATAREIVAQTESVLADPARLQAASFGAGHPATTAGAVAGGTLPTGGKVSGGDTGQTTYFGYDEAANTPAASITAPGAHKAPRSVHGVRPASQTGAT